MGPVPCGGGRRLGAGDGVWFLALVRIQVAAVYFHAAVGKFSVPEWVDGSVLYYWLLHPTYGAPGWLTPMLEPILLSGESGQAVRQQDADQAAGAPVQKQRTNGEASRLEHE